MTQKGAGDLAPPRRLTGLLLAVPLILLLGFSTSDLSVVTLARRLAAGGATLRPHSWVLAHRRAAATEPAAAPAACRLDVGQGPFAKACHLLKDICVDQVGSGSGPWERAAGSGRPSGATRETTGRRSLSWPRPGAPLTLPLTSTPLPAANGHPAWGRVSAGAGHQPRTHRAARAGALPPPQQLPLCPQRHGAPVTATIPAMRCLPLCRSNRTPACACPRCMRSGVRAMPPLVRRRQLALPPSLWFAGRVGVPGPAANWQSRCVLPRAHPLPRPACVQLLHCAHRLLQVWVQGWRPAP